MLDVYSSCTLVDARISRNLRLKSLFQGYMKQTLSHAFQSTVLVNFKSFLPSKAKLGNVVLTAFFGIALLSCNKDGFYEKAALDDGSAGQATSGTTSGGGVDDSTQGGVSGGVTGGTDGSATAGSASTGSSTSGSTDGSTSSGSTSGGSTAGGTSSGTTTSGTTGSTTGGSTGSSTTGGSTTGSTTSGTTSGSTSSGSTTGTTGGTSTGGSTTGSSTGGTSGSTSQSATETFRQNAEQTKKLDILWVIDNSSSMSDEQTALGQNFDSFITDFITRNVDFKMAITTTDVSSSTKKGKMVTGSDTLLTSAKAQADQTTFLADFARLIKQGIGGSGYEKGLEGAEGFMAKNAASWMRSDAYLAVVIVSDEEDQSPNSTASYWSTLSGYKSAAGLAKVYTIVDKVTYSGVNEAASLASGSGTTSANGYTLGSLRYQDVSRLSGGVSADIHTNFASTLSDMGSAIINLLDSFALAGTPASASSIKVFVNDVETTNFSYDSASRSIKFDQGHIPAVNATIKVTYLK